LIGTLVGLAMMLSIGTSQAHNNVVVIPMFDEEQPENIGPQMQVEPFVNIQKDDTSDADYISTNGVTLDLLTGLEWQQVDSDVGYTFGDADEYCADLTLNNKSNWRLPSVKELLSIVNLGIYNPAINESEFPHTDSLNYWTADDPTSLAGSGVHFKISFYSGSIGTSLGTSTNRARCVRSNSKSPFISVFKDNQDGTITDLASGLVWQKQTDGQLRKQQDSIGYCENLALGGKTDWRLPEFKELVSIVDYRELPAIDLEVFPEAQSRVHWTDSDDASNSSANTAWRVDFGYGTSDLFSKNGFAYARCVH